MNFSSIPETSLLGKMLRLPLRLIPANLHIPILQGRLRGKSWIVGAGTHGYWLGSYEIEKQKLVEKYIHRGDVVYDIGAHTGYYSLLASTLVGSQGKVFAFEPLSRNIRFLQEHLRLNRVTNVQIMPFAVSDRSGSARFSNGSSSFQGRLTSDGEIDVLVVTLDELWERKELSLPNLVKIDVEGAELSVLMGAKELIQKAHPIIFLATHGTEAHRQCKKWLQMAGYGLLILSSSDEILALPNDKETRL